MVIDVRIRRRWLPRLCLKSWNAAGAAVAEAIAGPIVELDLRTLYLEGPEPIRLHDCSGVRRSRRLHRHRAKSRPLVDAAGLCTGSDRRGAAQFLTKQRIGKIVLLLDQ